MNRRSVIILFLVPLLLALLTATATWWVLQTASGSRWLWHRVVAFVPGELSAESVDGTLAGGFFASNVLYTNGSVQVELSAAGFSVSPTLLPPAATVSKARFGRLTVRLPQPPSPADSGRRSLREVFALLRSPVPVRVDSLMLDSLAVLSHEGRQTFAMRDLAFSGALDEEVRVRQAGLETGGFRVRASGAFGLGAPNTANGQLRVHVGPEALGRFPGTPLELDVQLEGNLDDLQVVVSSMTPQFRIAGSVHDVLDDPDWNLDLQSDYLQWPLAGSDPVITGRRIDLTSDGRLRGYTLQGSAVLRMSDSPATEATVDATGNMEGIEVEDLQLSGELLQAAAHGRLDWTAGFGVAAVADVARFEPHRLIDSWPAGRIVSGNFDAAWRGGDIDITELQVRVPDTAMSLQSSGTVNATSGVVDLGIDWRSLQWPIGVKQPGLKSDSGRVRLAGKLDAWQVDGRLQVGIAGYPDGTLVLRGTGDREQVAVELEEGRLLGGTAAGQFEYNWAKGGKWSAAVKARDLHTGALSPEWPGVLNAQFDAAGRLDPLRIDIDLRTFDGTLRDLPVEGKGGFLYTPQALRFRGLQVNSGNSSVTVDGNLRGASGIDFDVDIAALDDFPVSATGTITARGNVALSDGFPRLEVQLEGRELAWERYRIGGLAIFSRGTGLPIDLELQGRALSVGDRDIETLDATVAAGPAFQRLLATVTAGEASLAVALDGALDDWHRPLETTWRGRLESMTLSASEAFELELENPAALELSTSAVAVERACLRGAANLGICGDGHWSGAGDFRAVADLIAFPLGAVELIADTGLEFTQTLDGSMSFSRVASRGISGDIQLDVSGGRIRNPLDARVETTTRPGRLQMQLDDGRLLSGQLNLPFSQASEIDGRFEVLDVGQGEASRVEGQLRLDVADIAAAANVVPMIDAATGKLEADIALSGSLGQPRFTGHGSLRNGSLSYEPLGLELADVQLRGDIREENRLELEGTFRAGEGSGRLYSSADYLAGRQTGLRVSLSGQDLTIVDVPDVRVVANPELDFGLHEGAVTVNGRIVVPEARLSPANLGANPVRESRDVVVIAGEDQKPEEKAEDGPAIAINGKVDLELGDDIIIDLDIADARVRGQTTFRFTGPLMPVAQGQYNVSGNVQAYGQLLQITEGLINFTNVPADNPLLRIRAEREIFGNSQIRSAGVFVTGTAKDPEVEIYTTPATTESRALTLLVTGSDFNFEQGVGAVDVGTYIAPRLYLSYGIGLFDRENVISLRYDLAKGFGIKASSSTRTDGVDLSYTLER